MEDERSLRWRRLLQSQSGVITRQQARDAGFSESAIEWQLRTGTWRHLHRGTYATFTGALPREARLWAAVLRAGPGAVLSHQSAAEIHGLADKPASKIHITIPEGRRPGQNGKIHGVERAHGLPAARRQARRRHGSRTRYLDNLYEDYGVCVELDGAAAHPAEGRWTDTRRDNANLVQGTRTLRYGWPDVTAHRCRTAAEIAAVLRRQGWKGVLRPCGPGCRAVRP